MRRLYEQLLLEHFRDNRQMAFVVGPRQVGKTTLSSMLGQALSPCFFFNWDKQEDRLKITMGPDAVMTAIRLDQLSEKRPLVVFDELHKYGKWKTFLKGFFDAYADRVKILVTGSARLDVYKVGGDSLMGRYFPYRLHPLSVAEIADPQIRHEELSALPRPIDEKDWTSLLHYGGFPEPFLRRSTTFNQRWKRLRGSQPFEEDLRDLTRIQEIGQVQVLGELLRHQTGQLTEYTSLARKVNASLGTIKRWIEALKAFYYCFSIPPWTKNVTRSLLKEPKIYLWNWALVEDPGARLENFIASHLLKAVHFWTDQGLGDYGLYFLRDKEQREVDFLLSRDGKPWMLVEVKSSGKEALSKSLFHFQEQVQAAYVLQVAADLPYVQRSCFESTQPLVVPAKTFLSQLI